MLAAGVGAVLLGVSFAVFGVGDSGYRVFNGAARKFCKRMGQLGAKEIVGIGLGDDRA